MGETTVFIVTISLLLAGVMIPVPPRGRTSLWFVMLGVIVIAWVGVSLREFAP